MAYATPADVKSRYAVDADDERLEALLGDASLAIDALLAGYGKTTEDVSNDALCAVCSAMVGRSVSAPPDAYGLTQQSMTAGTFSQQMSYANPSGDLYMTKREREMLGCSGNRIGSIHPKIGKDHD